MDYLTLGKIINTHGIRGDLKVDLSTDFFNERFKKGNTVYLKINNEYTPFIVSNARIHKGYGLVCFEGLENINLVEKYKNYEIYYPKSEVKDLKDGYYFSQIENLEAFDQDGNKIGVVEGMEEGIRINNMRLIKNNKKSVLIPFNKAFVKEVDLENKRIVINVIEGLL